MSFYQKMLVLSVVLSASSVAVADHHGAQVSHQDVSMPNMSQVSKQWMEAFYTGKDQTRAMVEQHMADDGFSYPGRFVGFGFTYNPDSEDRSVTSVIPESPASAVLEVGDTFVSVNGVEATRENWDNGRLDFGGAPDQKVSVVVNRNGVNKEISFQRGLINPRYTKAQVLENIEMGNADQWAAEEFRIREVAVSEDSRSVYVWSWHRSLNNRFNISYEENVVTRFRFNESGQVVAFGDLSEESLVQSQLGFSVSR